MSPRGVVRGKMLWIPYAPEVWNPFQANFPSSLLNATRQRATRFGLFCPRDRSAATASMLGATIASHSRWGMRYASYAMSFDLIVECPSLPEDLKPNWEGAFLREGFDVEICPSFRPSTSNGGFWPMRLTAAPEELIGMPLPGVAVSGFEVSFDQGGTSNGATTVVSFRFAYGVPTTEFAMLCVGAALLAALSNGKYIDPQSGAEHVGRDSVDAAKATVRDFLMHATESERVHHPFPGWEELGC